MQQEIPPVVKLEEGLRDGVILAKLTKVFAPHLVRRIFESPRLQFRHSENINYFFQFLRQTGMPDLFTFELTDLYDKKNIPKVIYCIHALSFILSAGNLAPAIGNLVGKLEFTEDEIHNTQRGLDASGLSLPNFSGMNRHFEVVQPQLSEEEIIVMELKACELEIIQLQAACRAFLFRFNYFADKYILDKFQAQIVMLQSIFRARTLRDRVYSNLRFSEYYIVQLQTICRGYLARRHGRADKTMLDRSVLQLTNFQSVIRASRVRGDLLERENDLKYLGLSSVVSLQAYIRGSRLRKELHRVVQAQQNYSSEVAHIQAFARGYLLRRKKAGLVQVLDSEMNPVVAFQSIVRSFFVRNIYRQQKEALSAANGINIQLQSIVRGRTIRSKMNQVEEQLRKQHYEILVLQSLIRANKSRAIFNFTLNNLSDSEVWTKGFQAYSRGLLTRQRFTVLKDAISNYDATELQSILRGSLRRSKLSSIKVMLLAQENNFLTIQSTFRAGVVRSAIRKDLDRLELLAPSMVRLQSIFRGLLIRFSYCLMLEDFEDGLQSIIMLQAQVRGYMVRKEFNERMDYFQKNMDKVIKIQSFVRAKKQGDAYKSLLTGTNPPLSTVKSFVHLLADSDLDFEQELELEQNRKRVIDEVRNNEMLEQYVTQLDVKIALLLKNKITIDELVRHRNKGVKGAMPVNSSSDMFDLKALNKTSRRRLELYQGLFYIIQTQPQYLARLFRRIGVNGIADKEAKDIEGLVMTIFGYAQKPREQFFLLQLIGRSIQEEIESCDNPKSLLRGNFIWWKLVAAINRGTKERRALRALIGSAVSKVVESHSLDLESDPLTIYRTSINNEELRTGRLSSRSPNVPVDEAILDPEARSIFIANLQNYRELSVNFLNEIDRSIDGISYHMRYIAREVYNITKKHFGDEPEEKLIHVVGHVLFTHYLNPAIIAADNYGIVSNALGPQQTKNLTEVTKILSQIASLKGFSRDNVFLQPLNDYIRGCFPRMIALFKKLIYVPDLEQEYDTNMFDDLTSRQRPTLYVKTSDIFVIHSLLCKELTTIAPDVDDSLRDVLKQLGDLPNDASEILNIARFTEVKLDLNPSFCRVEDPEAEITSLYVATKRCILYVLRVQSGANLLEILLSPVMAEHEEKYRAILKEERIERTKRNVDSENTVVGDLSNLTYRELKLLTLEKVIELESMGRITRADNYQGILNSIALDIRTKTNRKIARHKELEGIQQTLVHLSEKETYLQGQLNTYNNYIEQAMSTLQSKKGKRKPLILPFTKQYFHMRDLQKSGKIPKFGSYKYSASNLFEKGVLVELNGYSDRQYGQVTFTFSCDEVGVFNIEAAYGSIVLPGGTTALTLDDLLGQQYNNKQYISLFDDMVKLNTNLTLHFIFRKFYRDSQ
jgi:Ras GTPase-activating-like protein IQGAP2/3